MDSSIKVRDLNKRWAQLKNERASWFAHYKEITTYFLPRNGRYFTSDRDKGYRRHNSIYDNTGTKALRTLAAGLMSGLTSPARPWFRLGPHDPQLAKNANVRVWLDDVTKVMLSIFQKSNTYRALHTAYEELAGFGTAAIIVVEDFDDVIRLFPLTTGEYCIATDWRGEVCTLYREFDKTVGEIVKEFGLENCSQQVQSMYKAGNLESWITLVHAIEPRADRDLTKSDAKNMAWASITYELSRNNDQVLRESGFKRFNALCPRWQVSGGDIYGNSPAMEALGDAKQLQHEQLRKGQVIDYQTKPPLQVPTSMKNVDVETLPGGISFVDAASQNGGIRTAFDVNLRLDYLLADMQDVRGRINGAFYADIFTMMSSQVDSRMTATEVAERHEEKMILLGPVLERLQNELLDPLIEITFDRMLEAGLVPPPPEELQGQELSVELVSMLAQAQRAITTNGTDRFVGNLGQIAQFVPSVLDKFNADAWVDDYSDKLGVDPGLIVPDDQVAKVRDARAKAQAAAAQQQQMNMASQTAKNLGQTPTTGGNAASDVANLFSQGLGAPSQ